MRQGYAMSNGPSNHSLPRVTFVLPGRNSSGGVRVTVDMASCLAARGIRTRILYRRGQRSFWRCMWPVGRNSASDWIAGFGGEKTDYTQLSDVPFEEHEIVIAVGSLVIDEVSRLPERLMKVRYCHGLPTDWPRYMDTVWRLRMPTIAVSDALVAALLELTGEPPIAVVPNGLCTEQYFIEDRQRDGIGGIYVPGAVKRGEDMLAVLSCLQQRRPGLPVYLFGPGPRPRGIPASSYRRLPEVAAAREWYNRSLVWLLTSSREGFPAPILEAMACGAAVVSSSFPTVSALIQDHHNGLLAPTGDVVAFTERVEELLDNVDLRKQTVRNGSETVSRFGWEVAADRMESCLRRLTTRRAAHSPNFALVDAQCPRTAP